MVSDLLPLHQQNPLGRFSDRAQDYARYRPTYPPEAITALLHNLGDPTALIAADIGAGTGISARLLGDRGLTVWAIEPNAAMRAANEPHPQVTVQSATAEATGLPDASVHLVTCCQAFHWFQADAALAEFHRILKPNGRVALLWNERKPIDRFTEAYESIICNASDRQIKVITDYKSSKALAHAPQFKNYQTYYFDWLRPMTHDALIGLSLSASYVPKSGDAHDQMMRRLHCLFEQWAEKNEMGDRCIQMAYRTNVYLANK